MRPFEDSIATMCVGLMSVITVFCLSAVACSEVQNGNDVGESAGKGQQGQTYMSVGPDGSSISWKWVPGPVEEEDEQMPDEQRLMSYLLKGYERSVRPVRNATSAVIVKMGLTLTQIFDLDERNQILVTNVWLDQEWEDEFLTWDPQFFHNITTIRIPCGKLWLPDLVLYNNAAEYTDGVMPANAMVTHTGVVFWPVPTKLQSSCKVDITYFPFDAQKCRMKFGSWMYDGFQVDIVNRSFEVDLSNYVHNGEWHLNHIEIVRNVVTYACCPEPFPDVTFYVHIQRRVLYYMYNVIFPCIMMSALTLLVFCLPPDSGEKIALGITVLLAFSVLMLAIAENLPETSEFVPLISIYLTIVMSLTSLSVVMTVFVLNLHHRGPNKTAVPAWMRTFVLGRLARLFCLPTEYKETFQTETAEFLRKLSLKLTIENIAQELKDDIENGISDNAHHHLHHLQQHQAQHDSSVHLSKNFHHQHHHVEMMDRQLSDNANGGQQEYFHRRPPNVRVPHHSRNQTCNTNDELIRALRKLLERHDRDDSDYAVVQDWRRVAQVVDRTLFWTFFTGTLFSTVVVLVIAPLTRSL